MATTTKKKALPINKNMKKLGELLYTYIARAVRTEGTHNPDEILYLFEEQLPDNSYNNVVMFLRWVAEDEVHRRFGTATYEIRYATWFAEATKVTFTVQKFVNAGHTKPVAQLRMFWLANCTSAKGVYTYDTLYGKALDHLYPVDAAGKMDFGKYREGLTDMDIKFLHGFQDDVNRLFDK